MRIAGLISPYFCLCFLLLVAMQLLVIAMMKPPHVAETLHFPTVSSKTWLPELEHLWPSCQHG